MKRNFRRQAGGASSQLKQPDGTQKVRPFRRAKPDEIQREMTGGGVVGCVCGNDFICTGYYEYDYMGQFWRNCTCCKKAFENIMFAEGSNRK
tara:strand:- start:112 stop:387 length:276 start_codon:yes stop_codon:yes gene_type:complete